ncbi:MAG: hypothetical protein AAGC55_09625, partial [Myxococcota bacterium]
MPRLLSPAGVAAFGVFIALLLFLLMPDRGDMHRRIAAQKPDQLSLTYLKLAVREAPHDRELRLLLAQQYYEMSRYDAALRVLALDAVAAANSGHS